MAQRAFVSGFTQTGRLNDDGTVSIQVNIVYVNTTGLMDMANPFVVIGVSDSLATIRTNISNAVIAAGVPLGYTITAGTILAPQLQLL